MLLDIHKPFLLQKVRCPADDCRAEFQDSCGHSHCRAHSHCGYLINGVSVWHPDECHHCWNLWQILSNFELSQVERESAKASLVEWVKGFGKSCKGKPYLLAESSRAILFPKAYASSVVSPLDAADVFQEIRYNMDQVVASLGHVDLTLEEMVDVSGKGNTEGDSSNSTTFKAKSVSDSGSFQGFSPNEDRSPSVPPKSKKNASSSSSSSSRSSKRKDSSSKEDQSRREQSQRAPRSPPSGPDPSGPSPGPSAPAPEPTPQINVSDLTASLMAAMQQQLTAFKSELRSELSLIHI